MTIKIGQVRNHKYLTNEIVYLVLKEQDFPVEDNDYPWHWLLLILDVCGPNALYITPPGSICGADEHWLLTETTVMT